MPELTDIDDIGGISRPDDGIELIGGYAIEHATYQPARRADRALIGIARENAFEQEQIGRVHQRAFETTRDRVLQGVRRIMQRAAMRRIDANGVFRTPLQANEGGGFGAVSMQDVRLQPPDQAQETQPYQNVRRRWLAADGEAMDAKLEAWRDFLKRRLRAFATGQAVGDDADVVAAIGLAVGEVQDVTEDSADRGADRVQDTKRLIGSRGHDQNQHSPTSTVSVGAAIPRNINFD